MRILKSILIGLGVLIALFLIVTFFLPANVTVQRTTTIDTPASVIYANVNDFRNWNKWSPWYKMDPNMKLEYTGPQTGTGSGYSWNSTDANVGKGEMTITESVANQSIKTALKFDGQGEGKGEWAFKEDGGKTHVTWKMNSLDLKWPVGRFFGLMMDGMVGPQFEQGLSDLKAVSEKEAAEMPEPAPVEGAPAG